MEKDNKNRSNLTKIEINNDAKSITITTADGEEGLNVTNIQGGCMVVILGGMVSASDDDPKPEPQPKPDAPTPAKVINFFLQVRNERDEDIVVDNRIGMTLANPDRNGFFYGDINGEPWTGFYNNIETHPYRPENVVFGIPAKGCVVLPVSYTEIVGKVYNSDLSLYGEDVIVGLGGRNLVSQKKLKENDMYPYRNVLFYVNGSCDTILCDGLDPDIVFEEGKIYTVTIR